MSEYGFQGVCRRAHGRDSKGKAQPWRGPYRQTQQVADDDYMRHLEQQHPEALPPGHTSTVEQKKRRRGRPNDGGPHGSR